MSNWFKKPVNIAITVGAALLAVAVVVLLIWGITRHTEAGLLEVCWVNGEARYVGGSEDDHGPCEGSEELVWPESQIPISVSAITAAGNPVVEASTTGGVLNQAISDINRQVGFELLEFSDGTNPDAEFRLGGALESGPDNPPPGYVRHQKVGNGLRGRGWIRSDVVAVDRTFYLVAQHELLHLVGLAHDDFTLSVMYPITREDWDAETMGTAHVTDHDVGLLRRLYQR